MKDKIYKSKMPVEKSIANARLKLRRIFQKFDNDRDGELSEEEYRKMLNKILRVQRKEIANVYGGVQPEFTFISKAESEAFIRSTPRIEFK